MSRADHSTGPVAGTVRGSVPEPEDIQVAQASDDVKITASQRMLAACSGSLLTSLLGAWHPSDSYGTRY